MGAAGVLEGLPGLDGDLLEGRQGCDHGSASIGDEREGPEVECLEILRGSELGKPRVPHGGQLMEGEPLQFGQLGQHCQGVIAHLR